MALQYTLALRNNWCTSLNAAAGALARILIYTGPPPANCAQGPTGVLLSSGCRGNAAAFGVVANGVLTVNGTTPDANAIGTGTAGYFRLLDASSATVMQGTISLVDGGGDLIFTDTAIVAGDTIAISSWTITAPGA